jgi:tRNA dimethylallyltransferase
MITGIHGAPATTVVIDSMQVYREIPIISNQTRSRPAELTGIVSIAESWTVADHSRAARRLLDAAPGPVLDAGTGMYLNATILEVPLAPPVAPDLRARAYQMAREAENPRRRARELELSLAGAPPRGSIWDASPLYDATLVYLRPPRAALDRQIATRTRRIIQNALEEAQGIMDMIRSGIEPNPSVQEAVGVREMLALVRGETSFEEAEERLLVRTRQLARRQMRWFDKLHRSLPEARWHVLENVPRRSTMHDIIGA